MRKLTEILVKFRKFSLILLSEFQMTLKRCRKNLEITQLYSEIYQKFFHEFRVDFEDNEVIFNKYLENIRKHFKNF